MFAGINEFIDMWLKSFEFSLKWLPNLFEKSVIEVNKIISLVAFNFFLSSFVEN